MSDITEKPIGDASEAPTASTRKTKGSPKKKAVPSKGSKIKTNHVRTSVMVTSAIKDLKERSGSSLQAIKKYIGTTYNVDAEKISFFIRRYIKSAVESGELVQTKGKGASGSFRLGTGGNGGSKKKKQPDTVAEPKPKKPTATAKKPAAKKAIATPAKKKASVLKAKTTKKLPTTPKAPNPKKATTKTKKAAATKTKKVAPKKKATLKKK